MGRAPCCDKANVKKGPWAPEEDAKLKAFIENNGTGGNWITLPGKAGLKRCGKSCRLRWINYLRPDIKHGSFTEEEERIIYELHASFGSRWSLIAAQLPGRTDNDIKNYWNTRLKKKLAERQHLSYHHQRGGVQIAAFAHGRSGGGQNFTLPIGSGRRAAADGLLQQMIQPSMGEYYHHQSDIGHHNQYEFHQFSIVPPIQDGQNLELHHVRALQNEEAKLQLQQVRAFQIKDQAKLQLHAIEQAERERQRHQQQNTVVGGCIDERLMVIESSLRNCISSTTPTSVDSSGIRSSSGTAIYPLQATIGGNDLSSVGMISSHHNSSPTSSCSNISTDWSPYAPSVDLTYGDFQTHPSPAPVVAQDRYSSQDNYHALSAQQTQLVSQNYMNTSLLAPKLAQLAIGRGGVAASMGDAVMYHDIPREIVI